MGNNLTYDPGLTQFSVGGLADFVSGLTADPSDEPRPSLSEYFTEKGVDAGLAFHDLGPMLYLEANAWEFSSTDTPGYGLDGTTVERNGYLDFGALTDIDDNHGAYVEGRYSISFSEATWLDPHSFEVPTYDENGNQIGTETIDVDGTHANFGSETTLAFEGYADTFGNYNFAAIGTYSDQTFIGDNRVTWEGYAVGGIDSDMGGFAEIGAGIEAMWHPDTGTYGYLRGDMLFAENSGFDEHSISTGIGTNVLDKIIPGSSTVLGTLETGLRYDGNDTGVTAAFVHNF